jgi:hypothetical protein
VPKGRVRGSYAGWKYKCITDVAASRNGNPNPMIGCQRPIPHPFENIMARRLLDAGSGRPGWPPNGAGLRAQPRAWTYRPAYGRASVSGTPDSFQVATMTALPFPLRRRDLQHRTRPLSQSPAPCWPNAATVRRRVPPGLQPAGPAGPPRYAGPLRLFGAVNRISDPLSLPPRSR